MDHLTYKAFLLECLSSKIYFDELCIIHGCSFVDTTYSTETIPNTKSILQQCQIFGVELYQDQFDNSKNLLYVIDD